MSERPRLCPYGHPERVPDGCSGGAECHVHADKKLPNVCGFDGAHKPHRFGPNSSQVVTCGGVSNG